MKAIIFAFSFFAIFIKSAAAGNFGKFEGDPSGKFIQGAERPLFKLSENFTYLDRHADKWIAPKGEIVDGASIPWFAWSLVGGPFSGNYLNASIIHDYYCCAKSRNYYDTHLAFQQGMIASNVPKWKAQLMWDAVIYAGPDKWVVDPSVAPPVPCKGRNDDTLTTQFAKLNELGKRISVAKFGGMARTMKMTAGKVLDVVKNRLIFPDTKEATDHLNNLYTAARRGFDYNVEKLGLMTIIESEEVGQLDKIASWNKGQIPLLDDYMAKNEIAYPSKRRLANGKYFSPVLFSNPFKQDLSAIPNILLKIQGK